MWPPTASICSEMSKAVRVGVPLNTMCSTRWATPLTSARSWRVPTPTQTPRDAVSTWGIVSVATRRPLGRVVTLMVLMRPPE